VCLTVSPALQIATPLKTAVIAEANNIWRPLGVGVVSLKNSTTLLPSDSCEVGP
jgi:hypothetical protein